MITLSILICSLESRKEKLKILLDILEKQKTDEIEIVIDCDNGEKKVGKKRNDLLDVSRGGYISFIDDDDVVSEDYVSLILQALSGNPDCVGIKGALVNGDKFNGIFIHTIDCMGWVDAGKMYYRCPNHLNPVRRSLAIKAGFPDNLSYGEDRVYSERLFKLLKSEVFVDEFLYFYNVGPK